MSQSSTGADAVRDASDQLYDALEELLNGDASAMAEVWSHEDDVTTMTELGGRDEGWDAISGSMAEAAAVCSDGTATRTDQVIRVTGDLAYELCTESLSATFMGEPITWEHRATNIYRKENGEWKVVHQHADLNAELAEKVADMGA
jgi:ketosteroid isomerase-like protein